MKKPITLILLVLFLLNMVGYYGVFVGLRLSSEASLRQQFNAELYLGEEVTIKIPITIPYASDSRGYERVDGDFEYNRQVYRLVKQKLQRDTLFIVCIKDNETQKINQALADYVKSYTDKPFSAKQNAKTLNVFSKDYVSTTTAIESASSGWNFLATEISTPSNLYQSDFNQHIVQPPEA